MSISNTSKLKKFSIFLGIFDSLIAITSFIILIFSFIELTKPINKFTTLWAPPILFTGILLLIVLSSFVTSGWSYYRQQKYKVSLVLFAIPIISVFVLTVPTLLNFVFQVLQYR